MSENVPPGSEGLPFVGEGLQFVKDPFAFFEERFREHGPVFRTRLFGDDVVCLVGPEAFAALYDDERFTRERGSPPHVQELFHPEAIPFLGGDKQKRRRALLMKAFERDALAGYGPTIERVITRYLAAWADKGEVRAADRFSDMCFTIANALFTGADPDRDDAELAATFLTFGAGIFAFPIKLPFTAFGRAIAARDRLREHVAKAVKEYVPGKGEHVLARLSAARFEGEQLSDEELRIELLHFFVAAHGALQAGLVHLTRALCEHRDVAAKTRKAVKDGDAAYVRRVTKEARRAYKIAPTTFFAVAKKDCDVLGRAVKKGWKAVGIIHSTMREATTFAKPADFDPDRFDDGDPKGYVAHGTGPWSGHRCAGEALADQVLDAFVNAALRDYEMELPTQDMTEIPSGFGPMPRDGLRLRVKRT